MDGSSSLNIRLMEGENVKGTILWLQLVLNYKYFLESLTISMKGSSLAYAMNSPV
jgi:hypothetical protein